MEAGMRGVFQLTLSACLVIYFGLMVSVSARFSSRGGGSRSSSRSSRRSSGSSRGGGLSATHVGLTAGLYYGSSHYMSRRMYHSGEHEPTVCVNYNDTDTNGTVYGQFICPMASHPEHYSYCCGEEEQERCCGFWDDVGRVIAVVVGCSIGVGLLGGLVCFIAFKSWKRNGSTRRLTPNQIEQAARGIAGPQTSYPLQSTAPPYPVPSEPDMPPPPSYDMALRQGATPNVATSYPDSTSTDRTLPYPVNTPHQRSGYSSS